jgi:F-type H+-transporting ATPase subunit b
MGEFFSQFGISWKLLLSQLINFALILIVLRVFVYKPLLKVLDERKEKIKNGMMKAEECDIRLKEVDTMAKNKLKEADEKCIALISQTDEIKKRLETEVLLKVKQKEEELIKKAEGLAENQKKEMYEKLKKEATGIIRFAIAKAIDAEPEQVDEKLIKKTLLVLKERDELYS